MDIFMICIWRRHYFNEDWTKENTIKMNLLNLYLKIFFFIFLIQKRLIDSNCSLLLFTGLKAKKFCILTKQMFEYIMILGPFACDTGKKLKEKSRWNIKSGVQCVGEDCSISIKKFQDKSQSNVQSVKVLSKLLLRAG